MRITIYVNKTHHWNAKDLEAGELNGSEEMVVETALALSNLGHKVVVYCSTLYEYWWNAILFVPHEVEYSHDGELLIAFKDPDALLLDGYNRKFLWTADANVLTPEQAEACDGLVAISPWHADELQTINPQYSPIYISEPGFVRKYEHHSAHRIPERCLYASSPDRGLYDLLEMWPEIHAARPNSELYITYSDYDRPLPDGVTSLGRLNEKMMLSLYKSCDLLLYPCTGGERFCITALKAQMYGCIPVIVPKMALRTTVKCGIKTTRDNFAKSTIDILSNPDQREELRTELDRLEHPTWVDVANQWEKLYAR